MPETNKIELPCGCGPTEEGRLQRIDGRPAFGCTGCNREYSLEEIRVLRPPKPLAQPAIQGYRTLTETEIQAINVIKDHAELTGQLVASARAMPGIDARWCAIAQTHLQQGMMALVRSVARPTTF